MLGYNGWHQFGSGRVLNAILLPYSGEHSSKQTTNFIFKFKSKEFTELMVDHSQVTFELSGKEERIITMSYRLTPTYLNQ